MGGGASRREPGLVSGSFEKVVVGGTDAGFAGGTDPGALGGGGAASLPGSDAGAGIDGVRMSGLFDVPGGGRLGVPTETTGTLGILGGGGTLSEVAGLAAPSVSSTIEIFGFEVMQA